MVFGIIYCLKYHHRFILYTGDSKFTIQNGWNDLFEPFVETVDSAFHKRFNKRMVAPRSKLRHYPRRLLFKLFNKNTKLTYELFDRFFNKDFEKEHFDFPELDLRGNLRDVSRGIVEMIYRFNEPTKREIDSIIEQLNLPSRYVSIHVRRGDKDTEFEFVSASSYMRKLIELSEVKDVFILTDDHRVVDDLRREFEQFNFYFLVKPNERGYVHAEFIRRSPEERKAGLVKLFASVEIMRRSELAISTFTTNPGLFLGMAMPTDRFVSMQKASWYPFENDDVSAQMVK
ncbi:O-fucosyltransferase family protein [Mucilaginibacter myungsuensis]|uniref:Alpha-(1,6)-fucosyltransferase N- and catalytic domain-containing protein n=1 Tax=Mucilaginibacter myungsuensis TaxID=649104 RepID=A0A929KU23_9SPHI|nr:hypothetical protein [Mucilaginibacter myungsuensis]MBE9660797.1 hypothetical protein [Mucilaginibacter myungsuensis]MDN3600843.1 hypothetical protein [Mucilaginibacter myungsuensis]